jgi:hypothetical protein
VDYSEHFRAVALSRPEWKDGDRITLPVSALETLQALFFSFSFFSLFLFFLGKKEWKDGDRITLPVSALETLQAWGMLGFRVKGLGCLCPLSKLCRHGACWSLGLRG